MKLFSQVLRGLLMLGLAGSPALAQTAMPDPTGRIAPRPPYLQMGTEFFNTLQKGEVGTAFDDLTHNSELANKSLELDALKNKTRKGLDLIGGVRSAELLQEEKAGSRLVRLTYLTYGDKYPLRWLLYFYEVDKVWRLIDLRVDDSLIRMFGDREEAP